MNDIMKKLPCFCKTVLKKKPKNQCLNKKLPVYEQQITLTKKLDTVSQPFCSHSTRRKNDAKPSQEHLAAVSFTGSLPKPNNFQEKKRKKKKNREWRQGKGKKKKKKERKKNKKRERNETQEMRKIARKILTNIKKLKLSQIISFNPTFLPHTPKLKSIKKDPVD